jgi:hypothetical protein
VPCMRRLLRPGRCSAALRPTTSTDCTQPE